MTVAAEPIALTVNGTDVQPSDLSFFLRILIGLEEMPTVRGRNLKVPSKEGQVPYPHVGDTRRIVLGGWVQGAEGATLAEQQDNYRTTAEVVRALFNPREAVVLVATLELAVPTTATISARPMNSLWGKEVPSEYSTLTIDLESVDPDWLLEI